MAGKTATKHSNTPAPAAPAVGRLASVTCPVQRVLAARLRDIEDLFCERFVDLPPAERLVRQEGKADDEAERLRNAVRVLVIGCAVRLGLDLGLTTHALHGHWAGYSQVPELASLHYATTHKAVDLFDALLADRGDFGKWVAGRYKGLRDAARAAAEGLAPWTPKRGEGPVAIARAAVRAAEEAARASKRSKRSKKPAAKKPAKRPAASKRAA